MVKLPTFLLLNTIEEKTYNVTSIHTNKSPYESTDVIETTLQQVTSHSVSSIDRSCCLTSLRTGLQQNP